MFAKIIKKALILLAVYSIIIFGIFIIQFKNDSIISEKIGSLHIALLESTGDNKDQALKNKFSVTYNGIAFNASEDKPVKLIAGNTVKPASLVAWSKDSDLSFTFKFTQSLELKFSLSDDSQKAILNIKANIPENFDSVSIPYSLIAGSTINAQNESQLSVTHKKNSWEFNSEDIDAEKFFISSKNSIASYSYIDKNKSFTFESTLQLDSAYENVYAVILENLKNHLISSFAQIPADSTTVQEQEAVSYVAAMAEKGKYNEALDSVPQNFKKSTSRTYLSAPYFNNLVKTNETLVRQMQTFSDMINRANETTAFDIYNVRNLSDYMNINAKSDKVINLLKNTAAYDISTIPVQQAGGILNVYVELKNKNEELAKILEPSILKCISNIESKCILDDTRITITENGTLLSVINAVSIGDAVLRYGTLTNREDLISGGRVILHSYLKDSSSFDLRTLSELYPVVVHDNKYYPHYTIIGSENDIPVWAWTCSNSITYENDKAGTITLTIDFPLSFTHYLIVNGIQDFKSIYIYDMAFRTDPRFETYNSSGYVYNRETKALLLKSRHRSKLETVRMVSESAEAASLVATDVATGLKMTETGAESNQ